MNPQSINRRVAASRSGFTLIELLLVLVILAILAAVVVPKFTGRSEQAKISAAKADISTMKTAIQMFETDTGKFPTTLDELVNKPGDLAGWQRPYVEKVPNDPWGHTYIYRSPGSDNKDFELMSAGPDGAEGGADDVAP